MILAMVAIALAVVLHVHAARLAASQGYGATLPRLSSTDRSQPALRVRRAQTMGWVLSLLGAYQVGNHFSSESWWLAVGLAVAILVLVNGLPSLVVTAAYRLRSSRATNPGPRLPDHV